VNDRELTFCVSGQLWNRSLVMLDVETESLWSHILGEAMRGPLEGAVLESLPSDMVTWEAWRREHPATTVLNLPRTARAYTRQFYKQPETFVVGFQVDDDFYHVPFATLRRQPLLEATIGKQPLLISFDPESTSIRLLSRHVKERVLDFAADEQGRMQDRQTDSTWNRATGLATEGPLAGSRLRQLVGIFSFANVWRTFHPDSREVAPDGSLAKP